MTSKTNGKNHKTSQATDCKKNNWPSKITQC